AAIEWPKPTIATPDRVTASQVSTVRRRGSRLCTLTQIPPRIEVTQIATGKAAPQAAGMPKETARETEPISIAEIAAELAPPHTSHSRIIGVIWSEVRRCSGPGAVAEGIAGSSSIGAAPRITIAQIASCGEM